MPRSQKPQANPPPRRRRKRRRLLRFAVYSLGLLILAAGGLILFRNELIRALVPRFLGPELGLRLQVEEVAVSLDGRRVLIRGLSSEDPADWTPLRGMWVAELVVRVAPWTLLRKGLDGVESVHLRAAEVIVDLDRPGWPPSPPAAGPPPREPLPALADFPWPRRLPALDLSLKRLELRSGDQSALLSGTSVRTAPGAGVTRLDLSSRLDWSVAHRSGSEEVAVTFDYAEGTVSDLEVALDGATLLRSGRVSFPQLQGEAELRIGEGGGKLTVTVLDSGQVHAGLALAEVGLERILEPTLVDESPVLGRLEVQATANFPPGDPLAGDARLDLSLHQARWGELPLSELELEAVLERRTIQLRRLEARGREVLVVGDEIRASIESFEPEEFLSSISGSLLLEVEDLSKILSPLPGFEGLLPLLAGASVDGRLTLKERMLSTGSFSVASPLLELDLEETAFRFEPASPGDSSLSGRGTLLLPDLSLLEPVLTPEVPRLAGSLLVSFDAAGTAGEMTAAASFEGESLAAAGVPLGALSGRAALDRRALEIDRLALDDPSPPLHLEVSARVLLPEGSLEKASLVLEGSGLDHRAGALERVARQLPAGHAEVMASARGPLTWPDLLLQARAGWAGAAEGNPTELQASKSGDDFLLSFERLPLAGAEVSAGLRGSVRQDFSSGEITVDRLSVARDPEWLENEGAARIRFDREGRLLVDPPLLLAGERGRLLVDLRPVPDTPEVVQAVLTADLPDRLPIPLFGGEAREVHASIKAELEECWLAGEGLPLPFSLAARVNVAEFTSAGDVLIAKVEAIDGAFDLRPSGPGAGASVTLRVPRILVDAPRQPGFGEPFTGELQVGARWDGEEARIETLQGHLAGVTLSGGGSAGFKRDLRKVIEGKESRVPDQLDLRAALEAQDLSSLRKLVPALRRFDGSVSLEGTVGGTGDRPSARAVAVLRDAEVRFGEAPPVSAVNARVVFEGSTAELESFQGELGGAPVQAKGTITRLFEQPEFALEIDGTNVLLIRNDRARLRADTRLKLSGPLDALKAEGKLEISDGRVFQQIPLLEFLANLTRKVGGMAARRMTPHRGQTAAAVRASGLKLFSFRDRPLRDFQLDLQVSSAKAIDIRSNVFRGKVRPEVKLEGTGEVPYLVGTVYLDDFILSLPAANIRIDSGSVHFNEKNPLQPELNMNGSTRVLGYDITVSITGPLNEPTVLFTSTPPLPSDKLILLVATGQPPSEEGVGSDQRALFTVAKYFGVDLLRRFFGTEDVNSSESVLDRFDFEMGRDVSRSGQESWEARFRLKRNLLTRDDALYLTGEQDQWEHYNLGLRIVFRGGGA